MFYGGLLKNLEALNCDVDTSRIGTHTIYIGTYRLCCWQDLLANTKTQDKPYFFQTDTKVPEITQSEFYVN